MPTERKELDDAIRLYQESLALYAPPKLTRFWVGLQLSGAPGRGHRRVPQGDRRGPEFGNPYNDIGVLPDRTGGPGRRRPVAGAGQAGSALRNRDISRT